MNYEFKGTKGEWHWDNPPFESYDKDDIAPWLVCNTPEGKITSIVRGADIECNEANAKLIAAAPELLQACIGAEKIFDYMNIYYLGDVEMNVFKQLQSAIEKALNIKN